MNLIYISAPRHRWYNRIENTTILKCIHLLIELRAKWWTPVSRFEWIKNHISQLDFIACIFHFFAAIHFFYILCLFFINIFEGKPLPNERNKYSVDNWNFDVEHNIEVCAWYVRIYIYVCSFRHCSCGVENEFLKIYWNSNKFDSKTKQKYSCCALRRDMRILENLLSILFTWKLEKHKDLSRQKKALKAETIHSVYLANWLTEKYLNVCIDICTKARH